MLHADPGRECPAYGLLNSLCPSREGTAAWENAHQGCGLLSWGWQPAVVLGTYFQAVAEVAVTSQMSTFLCMGLLLKCVSLESHYSTYKVDQPLTLRFFSVKMFFTETIFQVF